MMFIISVGESLARLNISERVSPFFTSRLFQIISGSWGTGSVCGSVAVVLEAIFNAIGVDKRSLALSSGTNSSTNKIIRALKLAANMCLRGMVDLLVLPMGVA